MMRPIFGPGGGRTVAKSAAIHSHPASQPEQQTP